MSNNYSNGSELRPKTVLPITEEDEIYVDVDTSSEGGLSSKMVELICRNSDEGVTFNCDLSPKEAVWLGNELIAKAKLLEELQNQDQD